MVGWKGVFVIVLMVGVGVLKFGWLGGVVIVGWCYWLFVVYFGLIVIYVGLKCYLLSLVIGGISVLLFLVVGL